MKKPFNMRLDEDIKKKLIEIAKIESDRTGYRVTLSGIIEKAFKDYIENYKGSK